MNIIIEDIVISMTNTGLKNVFKDFKVTQVLMLLHIERSDTTDRDWLLSSSSISFWLGQCISVTHILFTKIEIRANSRTSCK